MNDQLNLPDDIANIEKAKFDQWFDERFAEKMQEKEDNAVGRMSIIQTKGTMDMAYPPFILASTAAALDWEVSIFFTFYGLDLLKKDLNLEVSPLGNPAMPMKMPFGPDWFQNVNWPIPNLLMSNVPGFEKLATGLMKQTVKSKGVASIPELRDACLEGDVEMVACQMTVDLFGHKKEDFIPEISEWVGATTFLPFARKSDVCLFI
jgi:peroxiredoxin family protein